MKLKRVRSEMLVAAGYDRKSRILQVIFRTGETYRYKEVPAAILTSAFDTRMNTDKIAPPYHPCSSEGFPCAVFRLVRF